MRNAYEGFCEDLARQNTVAHPSQLQLGFWRGRILVMLLHMGFMLSHMGFSHRDGVLKVSISVAARSAWVPALISLVSTCLSVFNLSVFNLSVYHLIANPIAWASFPRLTHLW